MPPKTAPLPAGWRWTAVTRSKRMLAPFVASFLCFLFSLIRPLSDLGGEYAFLCYTSVLIFFFPSGTTGAQFQATFLGIAFAAFGMAWAVVALAITAKCAATYGPDSAQGRAVLGVGLASMSFLGGWTRSYEPRLMTASRIALFFPIFHLTSNQDITRVQYHDFTDPFLVAVFAGAFALVSHLAFSFHTAGPNLGQSLHDSLQAMRELLPISLNSMATADSTKQLSTSTDVEKVHEVKDTQRGALSVRLKKLVKALPSVYTAYTSEIVYARAHPATLDPVIKAIKTIRRNPLLGSAGHTPGERIKAALDRTYGLSPAPSPKGSMVDLRQARGVAFPRTSENSASTLAIPPWVMKDVPPGGSSTSLAALAESRLTQSCRDVGDSICAAWAAIWTRLAHTYNWSKEDAPVTAQTDPIAIQADLRSHVSILERELAILLEMADSGAEAMTKLRSGARFERTDYRMAFYMTALMDLARESAELLTLVESQPVGKRRCCIPWLFWPFVPVRREEGEQEKVEEKRDSEDGFEEDLRHLDFIHASLRRPRSTYGDATVSRNLRVFWRQIWDHPRVLSIRVFLSHVNHEARHSTHVLYALKLSGGISLLALPAFMPPDTSAREWFLKWRFGWAVVSYMYVMETHTGAIMRVGFFRLVGTFGGAVAAYVCALIAHENPYALAVLATVCAVPISYIILFTSFPGIGIVAGITLPPILFINYLGLADGYGTFHLAWTRFADISIGIIAAVIVGLFVWPDHARVRYFSVISTVLQRLNEFYLQLSRDNLRSSLVYANDPAIYAAIESALRKDIARARTLIAVQRDEVSLLPRPIKLYGEVVDASERLIDTMTEIRLLRFSVPRQETVLDVLPIRRELVSAVMINLWAISQAFCSRTPLPQFLPSAKEPLEEMMKAIESHGRESRRRTRSGGVRQRKAVGIVSHGKTLSVDHERGRARFDLGSPRSISPAPSTDSPPSTPGDTAEGEGARKSGELAFLYAMAETEALGELCGVLEELVAAARTLFGSQTFFDTTVRQPRASMQVGVQ